MVPWSGSTALVGASIPLFDELALSLKSINKFADRNPVSEISKCGPSVIKRDAHLFLHDHAHIVLLDFTLRDNCQVSDIVSTNARVGWTCCNMIYDSLHVDLLDLKVILPNGKIIKNVNALTKDTGYHLWQLFVPPWCTIGVITGIYLLATANPWLSTLILSGQLWHRANTVY